jgi:hypothetical protein
VQQKPCQGLKGSKLLKFQALDRRAGLPEP